MRVLLLLCVLVLTGCGTTTPLSELREQAFLTGDWTAVEKREQLLTKRAARRGLNCPPGTMSYCEKRFASERCGCVDKQELQALIAWR